MTGTRAAEPSAAQPEREPTGWVGWIYFAGAMMVMLGVFEAIDGLVALFKDEYYLVPRTDLVVSVDYTAWGWVHLVIGVIMIFAGIGVMAGQTWARVVGVILAMLSAIVNIAFLAAYPVWAAIIITVDVLILWALIVHGGETKAY
jgi:hypothetical protein